MALAEAPRPIPPPAPPRQRPQRVLLEQVQAIRLALRSLVEDDDSREQPIVLPGRGEPMRVQRRKRTEASYAAALHALVDALPRHLVCHLPAALARLPLEDRMLLRLHV